MKKLVITSVIALLIAGWSIARAQEFPEEYLGLPGDNLNLYAVMKMFQESETLEEFERNLNDENSRINNLDLNGDNLVDYLMVMDYVDRKVHTIVLRAALGRNETQDVAVFTVQRFKDGAVQIQLVGDEALYGKNYIIEPNYAEYQETPNPGYTGRTVRNNSVVVRTTTFEVAAWPIIGFIYRPAYVVWRSSWNWGYYPTYYNPWRPYYWHTYYGYHYHWHDHYYAHYRPWNHHRYPRYNNYYYSRVRTYSPTVVVNINNGNYRSTYSRPDLRSEGEKLYARANSGRSSANTSVTRVRTTGSTSVNRSAVKSGSASERRSSAVTSSGRNTTKSAEIRKDATRRSTGSATVRSSSGSTTTRNAEIQPKSATEAKSRSARKPAEGNTSSVNRSASPSTSAATAPGSTVERKPQNAAPSSSVSRRSASPSVREPAVKKSSPAVSGRSVSDTQPKIKSAPARTSSRPSRAAVSSGRSGSQKSATASSERQSNSSSRSGRR